MLRFEQLLRQARRSLPADPREASGTLEEALGLWIGSPLSDLADSPSLDGEIARLQELRVSAIEDLVGARLSMGQHSEVLPDLERLIRAASAPRAPVGPPDARPVSLRAPGGGARRVPGGAGAPVRRAGDRSVAGASGAAASDPAAGAWGGPTGRGGCPAQRRGDPDVPDRRHPRLHRLHPGARRRGRRRAGGEVRRRRARGRRGPRRHGLELRGDEALAVFDSPRQAIRAAIELQRRFVDETVADPTLPLAVGIGLDAGEAVPSRTATGAARSTSAARLCAIAGPAEILASPAVTHLARKVDGVAYVDRGPVHLKGLADPVHVVRLRAEADDAAEDIAFRRALGARAATLAPAVPGAIVANPYKGLRAFEEGDALDFFGREELVEELVKRLEQTRFLAVVGPSGSGKSSVVRAGLIPALRRGAIAGSEAWPIVDMFPGAHPLDGLEAALLRAAPDPPASLMEQLERDEHGLHRAVLRVLPSDGSELVLVIDQFEEVFTLVEDEAARTHFLGSLEAAVTDPHSRLRVVVTLRADFYDRPLLYRGFAELFKSRVEAVVPLSAEELERAISGPAKRVDVSLEPGLVAAMLADVAEEPGALPLMEYALTELFERRDGRVLFLEAYREIGGVSGALGSPGRGALRGARRRREGSRPAAVPAARRARRGDRGHPAPGAASGDRLARRRPAGDGDGPRHVRRLPSALLRPGCPDRRADDRARARGDAHGVATAPPMDRRRAGGPPHGAPPRRVRCASGSRPTGTPRSCSPAHASSRPRLASGLGARRHPRGTRVPRRVARRNAIGATPRRRRARRTSGSSSADRSDDSARSSPCSPSRPSSPARLTVFATGQQRAGPGARSGTRRRASSPRPPSRTSRSTRSGASSWRSRRSTSTRSVDGIGAARGGGGAPPSRDRVSHRADRRRTSAAPLDWSPDGVFVTEGPEDTGMIDIRDATTGESVRSWAGHENSDVNDVKFSPDGSMLATTGDDGAPEGLGSRRPAKRIVERARGRSVPSGCRSTPTGALVAAAWPEEGTVRVVEAATGRVVRTIRGPGYVPVRHGPQPGREPRGRRERATSTSCRCSTSGPATSSSSSRGTRYSVNSVSWSPNGRWIATGAGDSSVRVWDAATGKLEERLLGHTGVVITVDWSPDSHRIVSGGSDGTARVWELEVHPTGDRRGRGPPGVPLGRSADPVGTVRGVLARRGARHHRRRRDRRGQDLGPVARGRRRGRQRPDGLPGAGRRRVPPGRADRRLARPQLRRDLGCRRRCDRHR